jgi:hypothetical protein
MQAKEIMLVVGEASVMPMARALSRHCIDAILK